MSNRILITGGLGFIGYHLSSWLINNRPDDQITIIDNLSSTRLNYDNLKNKTRIIIDDFITYPFNETFDEIFHLASPVGALGILKRNGYIARDIISLTYSAVNLAIRSKAKLLFVSSSEIYGHDGRHNEDAPRIVPNKKGTRLEYALGKLVSEEIIHNLSLDYTFEYKICRPFNVIGEHQSKDIGFVVPTFFHHALRGTAVPVFMNGEQERSFCHVQDIVEGIMAIHEKGLPNTVYNIGHSDNKISIKELAQKIISITGSSSLLEYIDPIKSYGEKYCEAFDKIPGINKVIEHTGWKPKISLDEALQGLYRFYSENTI